MDPLQIHDRLDEMTRRITIALDATFEIPPSSMGPGLRRDVEYARAGLQVARESIARARAG